MEGQRTEACKTNAPSMRLIPAHGIVRAAIPTPRIREMLGVPYEFSRNSACENGYASVHLLRFVVRWNEMKWHKCNFAGVSPWKHNSVANGICLGLVYTKRIKNKHDLMDMGWQEWEVKPSVGVWIILKAHVTPSLQDSWTSSLLLGSLRRERGLWGGGFSSWFTTGVRCGAWEGLGFRNLWGVDGVRVD